MISGVSPSLIMRHHGDSFITNRLALGITRQFETEF